MSELTRERIAGLVGGSFDTSNFVREAIRRIVEDALQEEADDLLARETVVTVEPRDARAGYRRGRLQCSKGLVEFSVPRVAGAAAIKMSVVEEALEAQSEKLERLALEGFARALSVQDIEDAFSDEAGRCLLSRRAAAQLCKRLRQDYQEFVARDLSGFNIQYVLLDCIADVTPRIQARRAVVAACGVTATGAIVLLGLFLTRTPRHCRKFLADLKARGLNGRAVLIQNVAGCALRST